MSFDLTRLPRGEIVATLFPGQVIDLQVDGWVSVRCVWPSCAATRHKSGEDRNPSAIFNPTRGAFKCKVSDARASGWRELVSQILGPAAWERYREPGFTEPRRGAPPPLEDLWRGLDPEHRWTDLYRIDHELRARYLRAGRRLPGEVYSDSVVGIFDATGKLSGVKFRLPAGKRWVHPPKKGHPDDKYLAAVGSSLAGVVFLGDRVRAGATLLVCAGEKDALVAASHLDPARWAPVSGCVGECADELPAKWRTAITALARGRDVVIAYDGDAPGHAGTWRLSCALAEGGATSVLAAVMPSPDELAPPRGEERWDVAAYALERGGQALEQLLAAAAPVPSSWKPAPPPPGLADQQKRPKGPDAGGAGAPPHGGDRSEGGGGGGGGGGDEESIATALVRFAEAHVELFQDLSGRPYVAVTRDGVRQTQDLRGTAFARWLAAAWYEDTEEVAAPGAITAALGVLEGRAAQRPREAVHVRVANVGDRVYVDMADDRWRAIEVTAEGWRIVDTPPVRFKRRDGMLALPDPVRGGALDDLWPLVNVPEENDWILVKAWLVAAFRGRGPFWILLLQGEQGSAKSSAAKILRNLIDPNAVPIRAAPKDGEDFMVAANASAVTCFDNLSGCPAWLSDSLCRLATGGGFSTRRFYTNDEEALFWSVRPVLLNGIDEIATRPDLADRSLLVRLPLLDESDRMEEEELDRRVAEVHPRVLGALLDATACALRRRPTVKLERLPRMADATRWAVAASPAMGFPDVALPEILAANRAEQDLVGLESDVVAGAVQALLHQRGKWAGKSRQLLEDLAEAAGQKTASSRSWPKNEAQLGSRLKRIAPVLRRQGIEVKELRQDNERYRIIQKVGEDDGAGDARIGERE